MRVAEYDSRASAASCVRNDGVDGQADLDLLAFVASEMDAVQLLVHVRDEQALSSRIGLCKAAGEEVAGRC
jgi:hypothetical protein